MPSQRLGSVLKGVARWTFYGLMAVMGMGCGFAAVGGAWFGYLALREEEPRLLEVRVDPTLDPDGGWRVGQTILTRPPDRESWGEVSASKKSGGLCVVVRTHWPPYWGDLEFELTDMGDGAPRVEVRGGTHEATSGSEWPDTNTGGLIRVSSADLPSDAWLPDKRFVIQYDLVSTCSGSGVTRSGKLVLTRDDLR